MAQYEIVQLFERNKNKWLTIDELSEKLKINKSTVSMNLKRMAGEVEWRHRTNDFKVNPKKEFRLKDETQRKIRKED